MIGNQAAKVDQKRARQRRSIQATKDLDGRDLQISEVRAIGNAAQAAADLAQSSAILANNNAVAANTNANSRIRDAAQQVTAIHINDVLNNPSRSSPGLRSLGIVSGYTKQGGGSARIAAPADHTHSIPYDILPRNVRDALETKRGNIRAQTGTTTPTWAQYNDLRQMVLVLCHLIMDNTMVTFPELASLIDNDPDFGAVWAADQSQVTDYFSYYLQQDVAAFTGIAQPTSDPFYDRIKQGWIDDFKQGSKVATRVVRGNGTATKRSSVGGDLSIA